MSFRGSLLVAVGVTAALTAATAAANDPGASDARGLELFTTRLRVLLAHRCAGCHGAGTVEAGFDMSTREKLLAGGERGPAVVPGSAAKSLMFRLAARLEEPHMPEEGDALTTEELTLLAEWIDRGAPFDKPLVDASDRGPWTERAIKPEARDYWAFRPLAVVTPPQVRDPAGWCRNPIDRFVLARLEAAGVGPSPEAPQQTLRRRLSFDLTGLPATPQEIAAFCEAWAKDPRAAYDRAVDDLLSRPAFGERWAQHWLDVARFAESFGYEQDYDRPHAHHYRDFVIRAFNDDLPYDTFLRWQLAGDELAPDDVEAWKATGFLAAGAFPTQLTEKEFESARATELDDMVGTVGTAMLGVTIGCARCHDHKFDPLPQADYYRMAATFTKTIRSNVEIPLDPARDRERLAAWETGHAAAVKAREKYEKEELPKRFEAFAADWKPAPADPSDPDRTARDRVSALLAKPAAERNAAEKRELSTLHAKFDDGWRALDQAVREIDAAKPPVVKVLVASENVPKIPHHADGRGFPHFYPETHFLRRGDASQKEGVATTGFLQVLVRHPEGSAHWIKPAPPGAKSSHSRAAMARWITDADHGAGHVAARVVVNRLWQHHFGEGLVATPSDFGRQADSPSHPELLDWLAGELIRGGWRLKPIHLLMVTSSAYRQSSAVDPAKAKVDPGNRLVWRFNRRRLEGEAIRDTLLSLSGGLDPALYGRAGRDETVPRRSLYLERKRSRLPLFLRTFDSPDFVSGVAKRSVTTTAPQALAMMNSPQVRTWAERFAAKLAAESATISELPPLPGQQGPPAADDGPQGKVIRAAYATAVGRAATATELHDARLFIESQQAAYKAAGRGDGATAAVADFCQVLMGLNETLHIE
jgi:mono/diheme cytochrome c family protein